MVLILVLSVLGKMVQEVIPDDRTDQLQGQGPLKDPVCSVWLRQ